MNKAFDRSIGLLKEENFNIIQQKTICIFGLGGVGGTAIEALVRTGFSKVILVDFDNVDISNLNRQILFTRNDIGKSKVECAKERLLSINPDLDTSIYKIKAQDFDFNQKIDFVIDAIDDVNGKVFIAKNCIEKNIPFLISLGMANRFDPSKVKISKLNKTFNDPLAKKIRYIFKENMISLNAINVIWSEESSVPFEGKLNSIMTVPSAAGLNIAYYVINYFIKENKDNE